MLYVMWMYVNVIWVLFFCDYLFTTAHFPIKLKNDNMYKTRPHAFICEGILSIAICYA